MDWLVIKLLKSNTHFILVWRDVVFCYSHACLSLYFPWVIGSVFERNVQISPLLILITILFWVHLHLIPLSGNQFSISLKLNIHPWMRYGFVEMDQACERLRHEFTTLAGCIWKKHKIHISTTRKYFIKWQNTLHTWYWLVDWLIETFLYNTYIQTWIWSQPVTNLSGFQVCASGSRSASSADLRDGRGVLGSELRITIWILYVFAVIHCHV